MAGVAIGGIALGAVGGYSLIPGKETIVTQDVPLEVPEHPWTYTKIDPVAAARRGYDAFFQGGCCYGVFEGIIGELREQVGHPFYISFKMCFIICDCTHLQIFHH